MRATAAARPGLQADAGRTFPRLVRAAGSGATPPAGAAFLRTGSPVQRSAAMKSILLWLVGVPITVIILLNLLGLLG